MLSRGARVILDSDEISARILVEENSDVKKKMMNFLNQKKKHVR
jgi:hypothetical protein